MKRSELVEAIKDAVWEAGQYSDEESALEFASDLADTLEEKFALVDEEEDEEDEEEF
jgi:hypothetical protein